MTEHNHGNNGTHRAEELLLLYELDQIALFRGILVLEDYLDHIGIPVVQKGVEMIVNGVDPDEVRRHFDSFVEKETNEDQITTLKILRDAVLDIQSGGSPFYIIQHNAHVLDRDEEAWLWKQLVDFEQLKRSHYRTLTEKIVDIDLCKRVDDILSLIFVHRTKVVMIGIEWDVLARALPGCAGDIQIRMIDVMPNMEVRAMLRLYETAFPEDEEIRSGLRAIVEQHDLMMNTNKGMDGA